MKLPSKKEVIGILLSAEEVEFAGGSVILLSIQDSEDNIVNLSTSPGYWKKVGKLFAVDTCVKVSYEQRVKNVTGYVDAQGNEHLHTSDGLNLVGITRFSATSFQRMLDQKDIESGVGILSAVEADRVSAVATYLSAFVRK